MKRAARVSRVLCAALVVPVLVCAVCLTRAAGAVAGFELRCRAAQHLLLQVETTFWTRR